MNDTHDPRLESWVESAQNGATDFPIQNLPIAIFRAAGSPEPPRAGMAIGDRILDLASCKCAGLLEGDAARAGEACMRGDLNSLMSLGGPHWSALRRRASELLRVDGHGFRRDPGLLRAQLVPMTEAEFSVPARIGDYTDFYASLYHALNLGSMFRPESPLLPNYKHVPVAYHGRSSSVVVSGSPIRRPEGQALDPDSQLPQFRQAKSLDYELEVGFFVGPGNNLGCPIPIESAEDHIFGFCIVNDWSARDIQRWEYQPLGPFLGKNFGTTVSPWVVSIEALQPFRCSAFARPDEDPAPLSYLVSQHDRDQGGIELELEVWLASREMRVRGIAPVLLSRGNYRDVYWTAAQMITHHASNGCNLRPGDLIASGTVSGRAKESYGSLIELTRSGREPLLLPSGERRGFLEDGDEITMRGKCRREGFVSIGFGECRGTVAARAEC